MRVLLIIVALFLSACSSTQGLSIFSLSNTEIETVLREQRPQMSKKFRILGLPVQFDVNDVSVNIGPDNRDVVALSVDSSAVINALITKYPASLKLKIEGTPFYDSQKKAVFVRNVKLLDSSIDAGGYSGNLGILNNEAMLVINTFLDTNPVYTLNMNDPKMVLLSKLPLDMKIVQGAITLVPRL